MNVIIREYQTKDLNQMVDVWNEVVSDGISFPQEELLTVNTARESFDEQTYVGVATDEENIYGLYILHPNNVGRCGHIANSSYAVSSKYRGKHIGRRLVEDSIKVASKKSFKILQFNAVVESNLVARKLYEKLGFKLLGIIPGGFRINENEYENICSYYIELGD